MAITTTVTIPSLNVQHPSSPSRSSSSFCKFSSSLSVSDETSTIAAAATEALILASAAVQAARRAVSFVSVNEEVLFDGESGNRLVARRKKRRKRRQGFVEFLEVEKESNGQHQEISFEPVKDEELSSLEEAELCLCLKNQARVESARRRIAETQEHEPTPRQLANALRMRNRNVDKILCKGRQSHERITHNYRRLVVSIASRYRGNGLSLQDLVQEGSIGLLRGAERFNPRKGNKLSTYVYWWIREAIITSISNKSRIIRQPRSLWDNMKRIAEAKTNLRKRLGRLPSYDEIAEELNVHVSTVRFGFMGSRTTVSLDRKVGDQGGMTLQEIIPGPEEIMPENMVKRKLMKQELDELIQTLSDREAHIVRLVFGLNGQAPQSCDEIGRSLKLCRERIRQINSNALSKLRQNNITENLKVYIV